MKSFVKTDANLHTKTDQKMEQCLSMGFKPSMPGWLTIYFKAAFFYETQMSFPESASKTLSNIKSTAKYIFLRAP